jgi:hypothetical protein
VGVIEDKLNPHVHKVYRKKHKKQAINVTLSYDIIRINFDGNQLPP